MARKLPPAPALPAEEPSAAEQLQALQPEVQITIAGRDLVVREYEFFEGLAVASRAAAFIAAMHDLSRDGTLRYDRIRRLFGVHRDVVVAIAAQAADVDEAWVHGLSNSDKEIFMSVWFQANVGFFVHEVTVEMREERQERDVRSLIGSSSLPVSPPADSVTSSSSGD